MTVKQEEAATILAPETCVKQRIRITNKKGGRDGFGTSSGSRSRHHPEGSHPRRGTPRRHARAGRGSLAAGPAGRGALVAVPAHLAGAQRRGLLDLYAR